MEYKNQNKMLEGINTVLDFGLRTTKPVYALAMAGAAGSLVYEGNRRLTEGAKDVLLNTTSQAVTPENHQQYRMNPETRDDLGWGALYLGGALLTALVLLRERRHAKH